VGAGAGAAYGTYHPPVTYRTAADFELADSYTSRQVGLGMAAGGAFAFLTAGISHFSGDHPTLQRALREIPSPYRDSYREGFEDTWSSKRSKEYRNGMFAGGFVGIVTGAVLYLVSNSEIKK
jgi:hypothetical protein